MPAGAKTPASAQAPTIGLEEVLFEISRESRRLADQCGAIQWSISAILETIHHPDLGAEIHILQDIDRIQQTLSDMAALLQTIGDQACGPPIGKDRIGSVIRLESLRCRLGLSDRHAGDPPPPGASDVTWL